MTTPRIRAVRKIIAERQCTHALVTDPADVEYISGFRSTNAMLLISPAGLRLFTDFRYMEAAREFCAAGGGKWKFTLIDKPGFEPLARKVCAGAVVGIQSDSVTIDRYRELRKALCGVKLVRLSSRISDIAVRKLDSEIKSIKTAATVGDRAFKALLPLIRRPVTEIALARTLEGLCADLGSEKPAFDTIVLFGERSALPHGRPGPRKLRAGDFVLIDFGCTVGGFRSDMTRTLVYGKASEEQRAIYDTVLRAQQLARKAARAGITGSALDGAARGIIEESGRGEYFGHGTGHGVGLRIHEKPRLNKNCSQTLLENSVVTIEPGIYIPGVGGVRIEDMVVLKKNGAKALTHSTRKLTELPL